MGKILNITNGDSAANIMKEANIPGEFLLWIDVLHDGPVPEGLSLDELSKVRAQFIIERGWGTPDNIINSFIERDGVIKSSAKYDKVILWFEHDLYDQLQILQILDWFHSNFVGEVALSIICTDRYLGMLSPEEMKDLVKYEEPVTESHLRLSSKAWSAFRAETPVKWLELLSTDTRVLPFLEGAILRLLEEYPSCSNGLSRTAQQALTIISQGEKRPGKVFSLYQQTENRKFLGDSSFWVILHELIKANPPLLKLPEGKALTLPANPEQELTVTPIGEEVLAGKNDWLDMVDIDCWIGGVHLKSGNIWCWNANSGSLTKRG